MICPRSLPRLPGLIALVFAAASFAAPPTILLVSGKASHGPGEHRFPDGCVLLATALNASGLPLRAEVSLGWPTEAALSAATALVLYSDGLDGHVAKGQVPALRRHTSAGKGLAVLHFAVEPSPGDLADYLLETIGGRFETEWSVNPLWKVEQPKLAEHDVTRGVAPFAIDDEWYYHLRFKPGIKPVLQAVPPANSLGQDGPRSGNPTVRAAVAKGEPQILGWVYEGAGVRTFGFTGGHYHRNWSNDNFRRLVLNGIVWTAGVAVPAGGVGSVVAAMPRYPTIDEAIARGDLEDVRLHVKTSPGSVHRGKDEGMTPLHQAILRNRTEIAVFLLDSGANPDTPDRSQRTPLHLAVERANVALVQTLLARKAKPNELDRTGWTPLHHAAAKDKVAVAQALLAGGANPKTLSERGGTALHEAAASGSAAMVQLFLKAGVDPNVVSKLGVTALDIAREYKNEAAIGILTPLTTVKK
jgi:type 1 glutamine amidotransferase